MLKTLVKTFTFYTMQTANVKTSPPDLFMLFAWQKDSEIHFLFVFTRHIYVIYTADLGDTAVITQVAGCRFAGCRFPRVSPPFVNIV